MSFCERINLLAPFLREEKYMSQSYYIINHYYYLNLKTRSEEEMKPDVINIQMPFIFLEKEKTIMDNSKIEFSPEIF